MYMGDVMSSSQKWSDKNVFKINNSVGNYGNECRHGIYIAVIYYIYIYR